MPRYPPPRGRRVEVPHRLCVGRVHHDTAAFFLFWLFVRVSGRRVARHFCGLFGVLTMEIFQKNVAVQVTAPLPLQQADPCRPSPPLEIPVVPPYSRETGGGHHLDGRCSALTHSLHVRAERGVYGHTVAHRRNFLGAFLAEIRRLCYTRLAYTSYRA